jgi:L-lactate dehydrogenase complex protein LldE
MKVRLMLTCLCDGFFGEVGIAAVKVLEAVGCEVEFDDRQTCCGQPPFNAGDWDASRKIAEHCLEVLPPGQVPVVTPSGSCAAMIREGYPMLFPDRPFPDCYEVGEFLVKEMGIADLSPLVETTSPAIKVAFHRACHGRSIGLSDEQETLLGSIPSIELVPFDQAEQCCGFGGAFSATHGKLSSGIGMEKLRNIQDSGAELIVSGDMGCLMHLQGLIGKNGLGLQTKHYLELIAERLPQ